MTSINPYLNFNGNAEEAFNFYKSIFGGEFITFQKFKDMPDGDKLPPEDSNKVMHVSLPIGKNILMASDTAGPTSSHVVFGNNFHISINPDSREETERLFRGLALGGTITMDLQDTFWNSYFGMLTDKFGINWMVNFHKN